jgi:hypothetical protein
MYSLKIIDAGLRLICSALAAQVSALLLDGAVLFCNAERATVDTIFINMSPSLFSSYSSSQHRYRMN